MGDHVLDVEILRTGDLPMFCAGPDRAGLCPRRGNGQVVPCAGGELHVHSAPDDVWVFVAAEATTGCPLGWLMTGPETEPGTDVFPEPRRQIWG